ncbi:MAG: hypothetical protein JWO70_205 [Betaproteobacteria bacterium]|nr:hypothetical protein [Betaproteobacteria bacterium]
MGRSQDLYVQRFLAVSRVALGLAPEARPNPDMHVLQRQMPAISGCVRRGRSSLRTAGCPDGRQGRPPV